MNIFQGSGESDSEDSEDLLRDYADYVSYHRFCRDASHNAAAHCGLQSYQAYRSEQRPELNLERSRVQPHYPVVVEPVRTFSGPADPVPHYPANHEPVNQVNPAGSRQPVNPEPLEAESRRSEHEMRRSAERQFHYYTSWGRFDRSMYRFDSFMSGRDDVRPWSLLAYK